VYCEGLASKPPSQVCISPFSTSAQQPVLEHMRSSPVAHVVTTQWKMLDVPSLCCTQEPSAEKP